MKANVPASPTVKIFLPVAVPLILLGWSGLVALILFTSPNGGTRWLLFFTGVLAITGTFLPAMAFLNRRFPSTPPATAGVILRQAVWVGIYIPFLAWLQIGRVLSPSLALLLAIGLILIEWLLRLREISQREPKA
jgi:hypothetical protein